MAGLLIVGALGGRFRPAERVELARFLWPALYMVRRNKI